MCRSGTLPAPAIPRVIGRYLFDRMRDLNTIRKFLDNSYANKGGYDETLVRASIMFVIGVWKVGHDAY